MLETLALGQLEGVGVPAWAPVAEVSSDKSVSTAEPCFLFREVNAIEYPNKFFLEFKIIIYNYI